MTYLVEARSGDRAMELEDLEWRMMVRLAHRHGWQPQENLDDYVHDPPQVIPVSVSQAIAEALKRAIERLPGRSSGDQATWTTGALSHTPSPDPQTYFGGGRRLIVREFLKLCQQGPLEVISRPTR